MLKKTVTYPQVEAPDADALLWVPVKRVTFTLTVGQLTFTASRQAKPVTPEAFKR